MKKNRSLKDLRPSGRMSLSLIFAIIVGLIVLSALLVAMGLSIALSYTGIMDINGTLDTRIVLLFVLVFSLVLGTGFAFASSHIPLRPISRLAEQLNRLAAGDFKVRLAFKGPLADHPAFAKMTESFNKMAEELENTEMLRQDFINNLSHEFKTPIVSIAGLAKLVNKGDLPPELRAQYLEAIEKESLRLSSMATNVLNLTRVENQTILTNLSSVNLSEQIRSAVLLFESRWTAKDLEPQLEMDEHIIEANEELLKQVWVNLVDNAIKFAPYGTELAVSVTEGERELEVVISNRGEEIPREKRDKLFRKFYQADESHATEGNGIGLAVVKRIVELHHGKVTVICRDGWVHFCVRLPKKNVQSLSAHK